MVKRKQQRHTRAFKEQAVALAKGSDKTLAEVARSLGVRPDTLSYWIAHPPRDRAAGAAGADDPAALRIRLDEARERIRVLEMEKEILKKATAFFAGESR